MIADRPAWHVITGEYHPDPGGVADYSRLVAVGLTGRGFDVHVWTGPARGQGDDPGDGGVTVHREAGAWSSADLARVGRGIDGIAGPKRLLVQYAPNAFGRRGLNFGLGRWLVGRRRAGDSVRLMFHEVRYIVKPGDPIARRLLAIGQSRLARILLRAADAVDVAIPYWERILRPIDPVAGRDYGWRPVPSNVPVVDDHGAVASTRGRLLLDGCSTLVGSFGTFADDVVGLLAPAIVGLIGDRPGRAMVLIGRGGERAADRLIRSDPRLAGRMIATGPCDPATLSTTLRACDLMIQPYPGGVCTKRGSLMAGIAHGVPIVTTVGDVTEPIWAEARAVGLAPEGDAPGLVAIADSLLDHPAALARLGRSGRDLYDARFAIGRTIAALVDDHPDPTGADRR